MSTLPPPSSQFPHKGNSNGTYIAIALGLVVGIGVLVGYIYKTTHSEKDRPLPPLPPRPVESAAQVNPKLEDIPPPPIVEEPVDAGKPAAQKIVSSPSGGCEATCNGTDPNREVANALQARAALAKRCYNDALLRDSSITGKMSVNVKISSSGAVCSAATKEADPLIAPIAPCVVGKFRAPLPAGPKGGCIESNVPFSFVPNK